MTQKITTQKINFVQHDRILAIYKPAPVVIMVHTDNESIIVVEAQHFRKKYLITIHVNTIQISYQVISSLILLNISKHTST